MTKLVLSACLALFPALALGQAYEGQPCVKGNPALKQQLAAGKLPVLTHGITSDWAPWSSSFLPAEGKAPPRAPLDANDDLQEGVFKADVFSCQHSAQALVDKDPATAWADGARGDGVGEVVLAPVRTGSKVWVWGGLGHSQKLFEANARPRKVRVWLLVPERSDATQVGSVLQDLKVVGKREVELKDLNDYQELPLPTALSLPADSEAVVALEILSVYPGKRYQDLCISEVGNEKAERPAPVRTLPGAAPALRK